MGIHTVGVAFFGTDNGDSEVGLGRLKLNGESRASSHTIKNVYEVISSRRFWRKNESLWKTDFFAIHEWPLEKVKDQIRKKKRLEPK